MSDLHTQVKTTELWSKLEKQVKHIWNFEKIRSVDSTNDQKWYTLKVFIKKIRIIGSTMRITTGNIHSSNSVARADNEQLPPGIGKGFTFLFISQKDFKIFSKWPPAHTHSRSFGTSCCCFMTVILDKTHIHTHTSHYGTTFSLSLSFLVAILLSEKSDERVLHTHTHTHIGVKIVWRGKLLSGVTLKWCLPSVMSSKMYFSSFETDRKRTFCKFVAQTLFDALSELVD